MMETYQKRQRTEIIKPYRRHDTSGRKQQDRVVTKSRRRNRRPRTMRPVRLRLRPNLKKKRKSK